MIINLVGAGAATIQSVPPIFKGDIGDRGPQGELSTEDQSLIASAIAAADRADDANASAQQAKDSTSADRAQVATDRQGSAANATRAETAANNATINANVYPDVATGRAAVADGAQFQVLVGDEYVRYRRDSSTTQTEVGRYPSAAAVTAQTQAQQAAVASAARNVIYRRFDHLVQRRRNETERLIRSEARSRLLRSGKVIYADPAATGLNDGTSWANAFTSLSAAILSMANGDQLRTNASQAQPFPMTSVTLPIGQVLSGCEIVTNLGPAGATWISGQTFATWTSEGSNRWSFAAAVKPGQVAFDLKQDDASGTVTGIDWTRPKYAAALKVWRRRLDDMRGWYGYLREVAATTTPGVGQWSYSGGRVYINPPGTPTQAQVNALACHCPASGQALFITGGTGAVLDGLYIHGNLVTFMTSTASGAQGYGVRINIGQGCTLADHFAHMSGYHSAGFTGGDAGNRIICSTTNCEVASNEGATANPWVFFNENRDYENADAHGHDLVFAAYPLLDTLGRPITIVGNRYAPRLGYSHTTGPTVYKGIRWTSWLQADFCRQLEVKHSVSFNYDGNGAIMGLNIGTVSIDDPEPWPIVSEDGLALGANAMALGAEHFNCWFDRDGLGDITKDASVLSNTGGGPVQVRISGGGIRTGAARQYYGTLQSPSALKFLGVDITNEDTNFASVAAGVRVEMGGSVFRNRVTRRRFMEHNQALYDAGAVAAPFVSLGGNIFDRDLKIAQSRDAWPATADRSLSELLAVKDPIRRDVLDAVLRHEVLGPELIPNGSFTTDIAGWTDPNGVWQWAPEEGGSLQLNGTGADCPIYSSPINAQPGDIVEISFQVYSTFLIGGFSVYIVADNFAVVPPADIASVRSRISAGGVFSERVMWRPGYSRLRINRQSASGTQRGRFDNVSARVVSVVE